MIKKVLYILFALAYLIFYAITSDAQAMNVAELYQLELIDVDKTGKNDSQTCMLAAMSNAVMSASGGNQADAEALYYYLKQKMGNSPQSAFNVWQLLVNEIDVGDIPCWQKYAAFLDTSIYGDYSSFHRGLLGTKIIGALLEGNIVIVGFGGDGGHAVTCYGMEKEGERTFLLCVDSDDHRKQLNKFEIKYAKGYFLINYFGNWKGIDSYARILILPRGEQK